MRHPRTKNMALNRIYNLQHVLTILEIGKEGQNLLLYNRISLVRKIINDKYEAYKCLVEKEHFKFSAVEKDQIVIF